MKRIKETITALSTDISEAVRINRKENAPISDERFEMVLKFVVKITCIIAITVLVLNVDIQKLISLGVISIILFIFNLFKEG